jgi:hypothetical protein
VSVFHINLTSTFLSSRLISCNRPSPPLHSVLPFLESRYLVPRYKGLHPRLAVLFFLSTLHPQGKKHSVLSLTCCPMYLAVFYLVSFISISSFSSFLSMEKMRLFASLSIGALSLGIVAQAAFNSVCESDANCAEGERCIRVQKYVDMSPVVSYNCFKFPATKDEAKNAGFYRYFPTFGSLQKCSAKNKYPCFGGPASVSDPKECCSGTATLHETDNNIIQMTCEFGGACDMSDGKCSSTLDCPGAQKCVSNKCVDFQCGGCGSPALADGCCGIGTPDANNICQCDYTCSNGSCPSGQDCCGNPPTCKPFNQCAG